MKERTISIFGVVSGILFGAISTWAVLKPDRHFDLYVAKTVFGYQGQLSQIAQVADPEQRFDSLVTFEGELAFLRDASADATFSFFQKIEDQKQVAQKEIDDLAQAANEAETQRLLAEQEAARLAREQADAAEKREQELSLESIFMRERVCLNTSCSDWIIP